MGIQGLPVRSSHQPLGGVLPSAPGRQNGGTAAGGPNFGSSLFIAPETGLEAGQASPIDVHPHEERRSAGFPSQSVHAPRRLGPALPRNPRFVRELANKAKPDVALLLIRQTGARSLEAADAARKADLSKTWSVAVDFR